MNRGTTLIELMIVIAMLVIAAGGAWGMQTAVLQKQAAEVMQRERALQALEYQAGAILRGEKADPQRLELMLREVPSGRLETHPAGQGLTELTVRWPSPHGEASRTLVVFGSHR
jgi:prepilin-type N-terminal cleavage/methylation domain-containing protein